MRSPSGAIRDQGKTCGFAGPKASGKRRCGLSAARGRLRAGGRCARPEARPRAAAVTLGDAGEGGDARRRWRRPCPRTCRRAPRSRRCRWRRGRRGSRRGRRRPPSKTAHPGLPDREAVGERHAPGVVGVEGERGERHRARRRRRSSPPACRGAADADGVARVTTSAQPRAWSARGDLHHGGDRRRGPRRGSRGRRRDSRGPRTPSSRAAASTGSEALEALGDRAVDVADGRSSRRRRRRPRSRWRRRRGGGGVAPGGSGRGPGSATPGGGWRAARTSAVPAICGTHFARDEAAGLDRCGGRRRPAPRSAPPGAATPRGRALVLQAVAGADLDQPDAVAGHGVSRRRSSGRMSTGAGRCRTLRAAATPVRTDIAPARAPARWPSGSARVGANSMRCSNGSPPKWPPAPCSTVIRFTSAAVRRRRILVRCPCGASKACFSYLRISMPASVPLKARW